jgi:hypothetical protein
VVQAELDREGIFLVSCGEEFVSIRVMSEETHPLKLKPRLPVAAADGAVVPPVASALNASSPAGDAPRFRLKPKLASELTMNPLASASAAGATSPGLPTPPADPMLDSEEAVPVIKLRPRAVQVAGPESPPPAAPELTVDSDALRPPSLPSFPAGVGSAAVSDGEVPKFKLKPKPSGGAPVPPQLEPEAQAVEIAASTPESAPPFPVMAPPLGAGPRPPVPIHIRAPQIAFASDEAAAAEIVVAPPRRRKKGGLVTLVGGLMLLGLAGGVAFLTFQHFSEEPPPPPKPRPKVVVKSPATATAEKTTGPTPSKTLDAPVSAPGKLIESAQEAVAGRRGNVQEGIDAIMDGRDPSGSRGSGTPLPGELVGRPAPGLSSFSSSAAISPGVSVTTEIQASKEASAAFRYIVTDAKVTGVYQGSPPRALINGRLIRVGQMLDEGLEISFEGIDAENRVLNFVDRSGARVSKRY